MSVRYLAEELYRWTRKVEELEKALASLAVDADMQERTQLEMELRHAKHEMAHMRAVLDAKKEQPKI